MKTEKYIVISSYVSHEQKTAVTTSPVFHTAIEALLHLNKVVADASPYASEKSYSFYEVCNWVNIDSTMLYTKSRHEMELIAKQEAADLLNPKEATPAV
jgi:hypothetical protein